MVEAVRWRVTVLEEALVGDVGNSFGDGAKDGGRVFPPHGEGEGKGNGRLFAVQGREGDSQLGDVLQLDPDTVEAIEYVRFDHVNSTEFGVGKDDVADVSF